MNRPVIGEAVRRGIEAAYTILLAYPYWAVSVSIDRVNVIRNQAVGIIRVVPVMLEAPGAFIEPNKTAVPATHPHKTGRIFVNALNVFAVTKLVLVAKAGKVVGDLTLLTIDSVHGARKEAYPQNAIGLLINRFDPAG